MRDRVGSELARTDDEMGLGDQEGTVHLQRTGVESQVKARVIVLVICLTGQLAVSNPQRRYDDAKITHAVISRFRKELLVRFKTV